MSQNAIAPTLGGLQLRVCSIHFPLRFLQLGLGHVIVVFHAVGVQVGGLKTKTLKALHFQEVEAF